MIEREIPKEIMDFDEKLALGLTLRQLASTIVCGGVCVPLYICGRKYFGDDITGWLVIATAVPTILIGFFKYQGVAFEKMLGRIAKQLFLLPSKRKYKIVNFWEEIMREQERSLVPEEQEEEINDMEEEEKGEKADEEEKE